jgi:hypothetical protein
MMSDDLQRRHRHGARVQGEPESTPSRPSRVVSLSGSRLKSSEGSKGRRPTRCGAETLSPAFFPSRTGSPTADLQHRRLSDAADEDKIAGGGLHRECQIDVEEESRGPTTASGRVGQGTRETSKR